MDLIKKKMNQYILSLMEKEELTPDEYAILAFEYEKRKAQSSKASDDTIMRIYRTIC